MFRMPAPPPEASNFAEGFVIISILSISSAGISSRVKVVGRPSIKICGFAFRRVTFPSISTFTEGTFLITSTAVPPTLVRLLSTLNTFRSIFIWSMLLLAVITTSASCFSSGSSLILPKSLSIALNI